jgi:glycosyltransferase involved in cell wall biosynthesis
MEKMAIDVVNTHSSKDSWLSLPAARIAENRPLAIRTRHLSTPISRNILSRFLYNTLPHFIITTGEAIREEMIHKNNFNPDRIISIPTGINTDMFQPAGEYRDLRAELGLPHSTPLVGTVSVIRSWKGLDYLIKAVPIISGEVPNVRFIIAGDGPHKDTLEKTIDETGVKDRVFLLGHREDIADILHSLDILVHPSYANEGVPQTILQAMAMEKPVVASDLQPLKEIVIENKTGLLCPLKDPDSIAKAVVKLIKDKELSGRLGKEGRKLVVSSYSFTGMLDKLEALYAKTKEAGRP